MCSEKTDVDNGSQARKSPGWVGKVLARVSLGTALLVLLALLVISYYYKTTPAETILITARDFPDELSLGFGKDQLSSHLLVALRDVFNLALEASEERKSRLATQFGLQVVYADDLPPLSLLETGPLPIFDRTVEGISLNILREIGMSLKASRLLEIQVTGTGPHSFRLLVLLKERPDFELRRSYRVPVDGSSCPDLENCAAEAAEVILKDLAWHSLILYYAALHNQEANQKLVTLYQDRDRVESLTPQDDLIWGSALVELGEYASALERYDSALSKASSFCPAHVGRGRTFQELYKSNKNAGDLRSAKKAFQDAIKCDSNSAAAYNNLGNVLMQQWMRMRMQSQALSQKALENFQEAQRLDPGLAAPSINIGYLRYRQGRWEEALDHFKKISGKFPGSDALFVNYGYLLYLEYLRGKKELLHEAIRNTLRSWSLNKINYVAAVNLGFFYYEAEKWEEAVKYWRLALDIRSDSPDVWAGLGLGLFRLGMREEAVEHYRRAVERNSKFLQPDYLRTHYSWSSKAAEDVKPLIRLLSTGMTEEVMD